jgi:hypothetical protein
MASDLERRTSRELRTRVCFPGFYRYLQEKWLDSKSVSPLVQPACCTHYAVAVNPFIQGPDLSPAPASEYGEQRYLLREYSLCSVDRTDRFVVDDPMIMACM